MDKKNKSIPQTNRSILFEEINPEKPDLLTMLREDSALSLNDDKISEINSMLLIRNFEEFMERFRPMLYGVYDTIDSKMKFTLQRPSIKADLIKEIPLDRENGFLEMILGLMDEQIEKSRKNQVFHFERMMDLMLPQNTIERLKKVRINVLEGFRKYTVVSDDQSDRKKIMRQQFLKILEQEFYQYHDLLALLPLAMEDLKMKLFPKKRKKLLWNPIVDGICNMIEGDLKVLDLPEQGELAVSDLSESDRQTLKEMILKQCKEQLHHIGSYGEHLILRSYGLEPFEERPEDEQIAEQYNQYLEFYTAAIRSLIEAAKPVMEKILGVKAFFDQYQVEKREMAPELLITNVNNDLWVDYQKAERLHTFLNTVNCKTNYENTIWFAILPNLTFPPDKVKKLSRRRFKGNAVLNRAKTNSIALAANLMNVLSQYQIQTFFGFESDESTTFSYVLQYGITHFKEGCRVFSGREYSEYVIPCFPNFTLIPKEKSYLTAGQKIVVTEEKRLAYSLARDDLYQVWMGGIHLGACYVAAGLTAAWQCPEFLKERYPKHTIEGNPGVRYDVEREDYWLRTITTMGREITGYSEDFLFADKQHKFGFFFSAENQCATDYSRKERIIVNSATVLSARSLGKENGRYNKIFKVLTANYIERIFRYNTFDYKKSEIIQFFKNYTNSTFSQWRTGIKQINGILQQEDQLSYQLDEKNDTCILEISFGDTVRKKEIDLAPDSFQEGEEAFG